MISDAVRKFIETNNIAFVASADETGAPHLAAGTDPKVPDPMHLIFEAWFCHATLKNVESNPRITIAVVDGAGNGYQLGGTVEKIVDAAFLDGYAPDAEAPEMPQVQSRLTVRVDAVMEFSAGAHSDRPL